MPNSTSNLPMMSSMSEPMSPMSGWAWRLRSPKPIVVAHWNRLVVSNSKCSTVLIRKAKSSSPSASGVQESSETRNSGGFGGTGRKSISMSFGPMLDVNAGCTSRCLSVLVNQARDTSG